MQLDEYVWRNRITLRDMSKTTGINVNTLSHLKNLKVAPSLNTAMRIYEYTGGVVTYLELLPPEQREKVEIIISKIRSERTISDV